jgi:hypothetical protein
MNINFIRNIPINKYLRNNAESEYNKKCISRVLDFEILQKSNLSLFLKLTIAQLSLTRVFGGVGTTSNESISSSISLSAIGLSGKIIPSVEMIVFPFNLKYV